jgi:putative transposase
MRYGCDLHAYVLMSDHVHLLLTPGMAGAVSRSDPATRAGAYRTLIAEALSGETAIEIRMYLQQQRALGTERFRMRVEAELQRFAGVRPAHRPCKQATAVCVSDA